MHIENALYKCITITITITISIDLLHPYKTVVSHLKPGKNFWNKFKIPRDDFSSGLEFLTKLNKHKEIFPFGSPV